MRQWNFQTDIEERNPWTGNVYYISRMTSDWAERHPLNVGDVIEGVYLEFEGTEFEESREALRRVWAATLSMPIQGNKTVYPNRNGAHRPAAMKVWHTAGDYWRRGFRTGDTLPAVVPGHTITRLPEGGWICLFPREMHLLDECKAEDVETSIEVADAAVTEPTGNQAAETASPCQASDTDGDSPRCDRQAARAMADFHLLADVVGFTSIDEILNPTEKPTLEPASEITEQREQNDAGISSAESRRDKANGQITEAEGVKVGNITNVKL